MRSRVAVAALIAGLVIGAAAVTAAASPISWSRPIPIERRGLTALRSWGGASCPSANLCVATDGTPRILTSTDPTGGRRAWTLGAIGSSGVITGISCPSTSLCMGADLFGVAFVSTDPTGGVHAWHVVRVHGFTRAGANVRVACSRSRRPVCLVAATASEWLVVGHVGSARHLRRR